MSLHTLKPYTVDVAIINANGHKCRFPVRAWASNPLDARRSAMDKASTNGHNVYGYHSVALA